MVEHVLKRWFEEQLRFGLRDGSEEESVFIGTAEFLPVEILREFCKAYEQEFNNWLLGEWKPRQFELREDLLSYSSNRNRYIDLKDAVRRQQVVPLVGSGMSVPWGLPTWAEFLMKVGEYVHCNSSELKQLIISSSFEEAADLLVGSTNARLLAERVEHELRIIPPNVINGPVCLLPSLFPNMVITTNLDSVLENVYNLCEIPFAYTLRGSRLADYRQLKNPNERFLLKLHGDCQDRDGQVLLSNEYETAYAPNSTLREELTLLYRQWSLLFLGCSLGPDRTVRLINEVAKADMNMPKHYAFLTKPGHDADRTAKESFLTERGIYPIWYDLPHDEAIMALLDGLHLDGTN